MKLAYLVGLSALACLASLAYGAIALGAADTVTLASLQGKWVSQVKVHVPCSAFIRENDRQACLREKPGAENYISITYTVQGNEVRYSLTTINARGASEEIPLCATPELSNVDSIRNCNTDDIVGATKIEVKPAADGLADIVPVAGHTSLLPFARHARFNAKGELELEDLANLLLSDEAYAALQAAKAKGQAPAVRWESAPYKKIR